MFKLGKSIFLSMSQASVLSLALSLSGGGAAVSATVNTNGQVASVVVGQAGFTSAFPASGAAGLSSPFSNVHVSGGKLYVSDYINHRVMVFNSIPSTNGASADYALGQPYLATTTAGVSNTALMGPQSPLVSGGKLFLVDNAANRVAIYNSVPTGSPGTVDVVAGQADKVSRGRACTATGLSSPEIVSVAGGKMVVTDGMNHRVLIWNSVPTADGTPADLVLGQADMTSCAVNAGGVATASTLRVPTGLWTDGTRLVVSDSQNNRVLIWNGFPTVNGQPADLVLGQADFASVAVNQGGASASAGTLRTPNYGVHVQNNQLFVADSGNNRVLVWNSFPTRNGQAADRVLGQPDFVTTTWGRSATALSYPTGVYVSGTQIFVTDKGNNRVVIYNGN